MRETTYQLVQDFSHQQYDQRLIVNGGPWADRYKWSDMGAPCKRPNING